MDISQNRGVARRKRRKNQRFKDRVKIGLEGVFGDERQKKKVKGKSIYRNFKEGLQEWGC